MNKKECKKIAEELNKIKKIKVNKEPFYYDGFLDIIVDFMLKLGYLKNRDETPDFLDMLNDEDGKIGEINLPGHYLC